MKSFDVALSFEQGKNSWAVHGTLGNDYVVLICRELEPDAEHVTLWSGQDIREAQSQYELAIQIVGLI